MDFTDTCFYSVLPVLLTTAKVMEKVMIILTSINLSWWIALINCKKKSFGNGTLTISVFWTFRTDKLIKKKSKGGGEIFFSGSIADDPRTS